MCLFIISLTISLNSEILYFIINKKKRVMYLEIFLKEEEMMTEFSFLCKLSL